MNMRPSIVLVHPLSRCSELLAYGRAATCSQMTEAGEGAAFIRWELRPGPTAYELGDLSTKGQVR
jgi:hypothetical protein